MDYMENERITTVIWAKEVKLNQFMAKELGSEVIISYKKRIGGFNLPAPLRYVWQAFDTYGKLRDVRPGSIIVMNPPIIAPFTVYLYCLFNKARFIIDTHTAGFLDQKWKFFHFLHRFLAKRAILNTVHNFKNLEILEKWGIGNGYVLPFYNPKKEEILPEGKTDLPEKIEEALMSGKLKVFMVNRFATDDAWKEVVETAKTLPEMLFFITGDNQKINLDDETLPGNVILTGYLEHGKFMHLMEKSDVILALTKRKDTVLWSVREIMALRKPFVTTESEVLRKYYGEVGIFTSMEPEDMKVKILEAYQKRLEISQKADTFLERDALRWKKDVEYLKNVLK